MKFDFSQIPTSLDVLHMGLLSVIFILLVLMVILLSAVVISLVKKPRTVKQDKTTAPVLDGQETKQHATPSREKKQAVPQPVILKESTPEAAVQLLGLLQQEARFIDFIEEDTSMYSDAEIGAAARVVHEGCSKVLHNHFVIEPIRDEKEDSRISLPKGFDSSMIRITGNIVGKPPFKGKLVHRGWRATDIKLPKIADGHNVNIIASAEVEL